MGIGPGAGIDLARACDALNRYIRPQSFPVAAKMMVNDEEVPSNARCPGRDFGGPVALCQAFAMARRNAQTVAVRREDQACPHAAFVLGYVPGKGYLDGTCAEAVGLAPREYFSMLAGTVSHLDFGKYRCLVAAPLEKASFQPDVVIIYGNPAQVARLVQAAFTSSGDALSCAFSGVVACSGLIARTMITGSCQIVLSGAGDRYFALTQDHELAFTIPGSRVNAVLDGLEIGHRTIGHRYPTPFTMRLEGQLPAAYTRFMELLNQEQ